MITTLVICFQTFMLKHYQPVKFISSQYVAPCRHIAEFYSLPTCESHAQIFTVYDSRLDRKLSMSK